MKKYLSLNFGALSEEAISSFEAEIGSLPESYRSFLSKENGGVARRLDGSDDYLVYGVCDGPNDSRDKYDSSRLKYGEGYLEVAVGRGGDRLVMDLATGCIYLNAELVGNSILEFLALNCQQVLLGGSIVECIDNRMTAELERLIRDGSVSPETRLEDGLTLAQYSVVVGNEEALQVLGKYGFDFRGTFHLLLKIGMVNLPIIKALISGGADINEVNEDGKKVIDIDSPWVEDIINLASHPRGSVLES